MTEHQKRAIENFNQRESHEKLAISLAATAALIVGFGSAAEAASKTKVCFIYVGSRTDGG